MQIHLLNESNLKLHEELEGVRLILGKISKEAQEILEENGKLKEVNFVRGWSDIVRT